MDRFVEGYNGERFDVIIVGGGISGAAVAYDAASRGLRVALLEKRDFGWATSAATSKLIHGGLRYLQNLEFGLVRESLRERKIISDIAPNLVCPIPFLVPGYRDLRRSKWALRVGLSLYDLLAYDKGRTWDRSKRIPNHRWVSVETVLGLEPRVRKEGMTGGSVYYDCQCVYPERLTLAFIRSAMGHGARAANHANVRGFLLSSDDRIRGVEVEDLLSGRRHEIRGSLVINCGGAWVDHVREMVGKTEIECHIRRSEGIHILTKKWQSELAVVMWTPAGRHFFMVPWRGHQLIGTTDKEYEGDPDEYRVTRESIEELVQEANASFGSGDLKYEDVVFAYGGLRPLVDKQTKGTYESSRRYEVCDDASNGVEGLISVEGGKYTTSRHLAVKVVDMVSKKLNRDLGRSATDKKYLAGCEIPDVDGFISELKTHFPDFSEKTVDYVGRDYGTQSRDVLELARAEPSLAEVLNQDGQILAAAVFAVRKEMARTLNDILFRRTGLGNIGHPGKETVNKVAVLAAKELGWDDSKLDEELILADQALRLP